MDHVSEQDVLDREYAQQLRSFDGRDVIFKDKPARLYLPTLAELIDRLCIVQLKEIHLGNHRDEYRAERALIMHDIDLLLKDRAALDAQDVHAIAVLMATNLTIWNNESKARQGGSEQDHLLKFTHSINGVRSTAKNVLAYNGGERQDLKVDCLAEAIPEEYGHWRIWI